MSVVIDFIVNLGLETVKDKIKDVSAEAQVKEHIELFLSRHQSLNFHVSLDEEIDFAGLADYIQTNLVDDVKERCFGNKHERTAARQRIMTKAVTYASAHTNLSANRTMKIAGEAVDILAHFFRSRVNRELLFIAGEIEEAISEESKETQSLISREHSHLEEVIRDNALLSVDHSLSQIEVGQLTAVANTLGDFINAISAKHDLFPYFGYRMTTENKMVSVPLTGEAKKLYPESYKITASSVRLGNQPVKAIEKNLLDQAYRHQLPIYIDVTNACKYLGNVLDPIQTEAEEMIGAHAVMKPPEFPPAFPCCVRIGTETAVPYLLMRTKEILDDGTVIITNEEQQNFNFAISIRLMPTLKKLTFTVQPNNPTNKEFLGYRMFLKKAMSGDTVTVVASNLNEQFIQGNIDQMDIENLNEEIEFLEKIVTIEDFFSVSICIPEIITPEDHVIINRIYDLIQGSYKGAADRFDFSFELNEEVKKRILEMTELSYVLAYSAEGTFTIFGQDFVVPVIREIDSVSIENLSRLKEKVSVLDIGDQIKIAYIPSDGRSKCNYIDRIKTEDIENGLLFAKEE